jgi:carbamoyl-phosphate synthase large subunit
MINSNPETVSTDYDTSDLLFFEPLTHEDVLNICERLRPDAGRDRPVRGQTPLNLARRACRRPACPCSARRRDIDRSGRGP